MVRKCRLIMSDIIVRAVKTFVQAFLSVLALGIVNVTSLDALQALAIAGVAAGISALQNFVKETM
jgi:hypothetical protein